MTMAMLSVLFTGVVSHVTFNPNTGLSGRGSFVATFKVPHGKGDLETTKLDIALPPGVLFAKPEAKAGWNATKGAGSLTWEAELGYGLKGDQLLQFDLQLVVGCNFDSVETHTLWNGQYTLWFKFVQHLSKAGTVDEVDKLEWTGIPQMPDGAWNDAKPRPAPYMFMTHWTSCPNKQITWHGVSVSSPTPEEPMTTALVTSIAEELVIQESESRDRAIAASKQAAIAESMAAVDDDFTDGYKALIILGFILTCLNSLAVVFLLIKMMTAPTETAETKSAPDSA